MFFSNQSATVYNTDVLDIVLNEQHNVLAPDMQSYTRNKTVQCIYKPFSHSHLLSGLAFLVLPQAVCQHWCPPSSSFSNRPPLDLQNASVFAFCVQSESTRPEKNNENCSHKVKKTENSLQMHFKVTVLHSRAEGVCRWSPKASRFHVFMLWTSHFKNCSIQKIHV